MLPVGSQLSGVLPVTAVFDSVTDPPPLKMPPAWAPMLPVTWLLCSVSVPPLRDIWGNGTPLAMPPPFPPARLSFTRLLLRVRLVVPVPGGPSKLTMPPPEATTPLPAAMLPFTSELFRAILPWFAIPAPVPWLAVLLSTSLLFSDASPPLAMPPPAMGGPSPGVAVAVLPSTRLLFSVSWLVAGGGEPAVPLAMPPPFSEVLPLTSLLVTVTEPRRFWTPPPPALGAVLSFT